MEVFFFFLFVLVAGIVWLTSKIRENDLDEAIRRAWQEGNYAEYDRLARQRSERQRQAQVSAEQNQRFMAALFILDAAEHGIFAPGAERVFDDLDEDQDNGDSDDMWEDEYPAAYDSFDSGWQDDYFDNEEYD